MKKKLISFVIPCYNEEENVAYAYCELKKIAGKEKKYDFEYVFVDNGSTDTTRSEIEKLAQKDAMVVGIFLSRNFGPEASGWAGIEHARGDALVPVECDLQDPPELIHTFIKKWEEGYDVVLGTRTKLEDGIIMNTSRKLFYKIFKAISSIDVPVNAGSFCLMNRRVTDSLSSLPEKSRFFRGLRAWVGFKTTSVPYARRARKYGKSSYNFWGYITHSQLGIFGFSYLLLDAMVYSGFFLVGLSFIFIIGYIFMALVYGNPIKGSITILVAIVFFGGIQLLGISVLGKYIQVIVDETKARPKYIIDSTINLRKER